MLQLDSIAPLSFVSLPFSILLLYVHTGNVRADAALQCSNVGWN